MTIAHPDEGGSPPGDEASPSAAPGAEAELEDLEDLEDLGEGTGLREQENEALRRATAC